MEKSETILYGYYRSSSSWRLRTILNLKDIPYTRRPVDLVSAEHSGEDYKGLNPSGLVPTLQIDGVLLSESMAIAEYLEERFPGMSSFPLEQSFKMCLFLYFAYINTHLFYQYRQFSLFPYVFAVLWF